MLIPSIVVVLWHEWTVPHTHTRVLGKGKKGKRTWETQENYRSIIPSQVRLEGRTIKRTQSYLEAIAINRLNIVTIRLLECLQ